MNYLDERIICTLSNLTIPADGLYRYDVVYDNDVETFVGNCFISKGATKKTIDITDIVRNWYNFSYPYIDTDFQSQWQVKLYLNDNNTILSDSIGIYPIYRYPNRKARMETPLSNNGLNLYMPALQGFNADKKGEFLPHIPFVWSDKVDYNIAVNIGNLRDVNPYLYTGVKKELETPADFGIYNTQYKLSELWKGTEAETLDWVWDRVDSNITAAYEPSTGYYSFASLAPLSYKAYIYAEPAVIYDANSQTAQTPITTFPFVFDAENTGEQQDYPIDLYIQDTYANDLLNIYPEVDKSCRATVHCEIKNAFENDATLITNVNPTVPQTGDYFFVNASGITELNITLKDGGTAVRTVTVNQGSETFSITDAESISNFVFLVGTTEYTFYLDQICSANDGFEYIFNFVFGATDIKIYPLKAKYEIDATFKTFRAFDTPLTQDSITIQNDGKDNLTTGFRIDINEDCQNFEVIYGSQTFNYAVIAGKKIPYGIRSLLTAPKWSYAVIDNNGKLISYAGLTKETTPGYKYKSFALTENNIALYIFATSGAGFEVTKIATKDFGIVKGFSAQIASNATTSYYFMNDWNAALNNSYIYQQYVTSKNIIEVAKVDACPSRYYLQWRDRYGSMQMQPFCKVDTYSEDMTRTEIKNYQDTRNLSNISIQPKWKLNTKWLNNTVYPYYESLLVSPWIKMYDTKEDTVYDVIITSSDYTEKTFKNQSRQQFNLQIDVEAVDKQNILY